MTGPEHRSVSTWEELQRAFGEPINFLMTGECVPFAFDFPPVDEVVDILRRDSDVRITQSTRGDKLDVADLVEHYRDIPLDDMLAGEFGVAHFKLPSFYGAGQFLHGFEDRVMAPWRDALSAQGFTWERCYPIMFISGRNSATNYHMDYSHVIAWQIHGSKRFCGLVDPAAWTTSQQRVTYNPDFFERPADLTDDDFLKKARDIEVLDGSTLILALVYPDDSRPGANGIKAPGSCRLLVANIGDCRAVLCTARNQGFSFR